MSLIEIAKKFNTDKQYPTHSYIEKYYENTFKSFKNKKNLKIIEIGVLQGQSLEMWNSYFDDVTIIGIDKNQVKYVPSSNNIKIVKGKSSRLETFKDITNIDIVIDDGSHKFYDQISTFKILFPRINAGGIYIIEDISNIDHYHNDFLSLSENVKIFDYRKNLNRSDDVIVEIKK